MRLPCFYFAALIRVFNPTSKKRVATIAGFWVQNSHFGSYVICYIYATYTLIFNFCDSMLFFLVVSLISHSPTHELDQRKMFCAFPCGP